MYVYINRPIFFSLSLTFYYFKVLTHIKISKPISIIFDFAVGLFCIKKRPFKFSTILLWEQFIIFRTPRVYKIEKGEKKKQSVDNSNNEKKVKINLWCVQRTAYSIRTHKVMLICCVAVAAFSFLFLEISIQMSAYLLIKYSIHRHLIYIHIGLTRKSISKNPSTANSYTLKSTKSIARKKNHL